GIGAPGLLAFLVLELDDGAALAVLGEESLMRDVARRRLGELVHALDQGEVFVLQPGHQAGAEYGDDHGGVLGCLPLWRRRPDSIQCMFSMEAISVGDGPATPAASRSSEYRPYASPSCAPSGTSSAASERAGRAPSRCRPAPCRTPAAPRPARSNRSASRIYRRM